MGYLGIQTHASSHVLRAHLKRIHANFEVPYRLPDGVTDDLRIPERLRTLSPSDSQADLGWHVLAHGEDDLDLHQVAGLRVFLSPPEALRVSNYRGPWGVWLSAGPASREDNSSFNQSNSNWPYQSTVCRSPVQFSDHSQQDWVRRRDDHPKSQYPAQRVGHHIPCKGVDFPARLERGVDVQDCCRLNQP